MVRDRTPSRFRFYFADVGPVELWGYPKGKQQTLKMAFDYQIAPLFMEREPFDVYMVDGRWRVACVMASFLHAIHTGGDLNKTRVLLHDYTERRQPIYKSIHVVANVEAARTC